MAERRDKLGRRIPEFDRSAAGRKAAATNKENDENYYNKLGTTGGKHRTRGYFGRLKDEGRAEELSELSKKARSKTRGHFGILKDQGKIAELQKLQKKSVKARKAVRGGRNKPVPRG